MRGMVKMKGETECRGVLDHEACKPVPTTLPHAPSNHMQEWLDAGIRDFRLEFAHETPGQVRGVTQAFADALSGAASWRELGALLRELAPAGVTEGSLYIPEDYLTLPILQ
jgi:putative protease